MKGFSCKFAAAFLLLCLLATSALADEMLAEADQLRLTGRYEEAAAAYERLAEMEPVAAAVGLARTRQCEWKSRAAEAGLAAAAQQHPVEASLPAE